MMKRHDDPLFEMFREGLHNAEVAPPKGAYAGIRSQMQNPGFFSFAWNRLNVYTGGLILAAGLGAAYLLGGNAQHQGVQAFDASLDLNAGNQRIAYVAQSEGDVIEEDVYVAPSTNNTIYTKPTPIRLDATQAQQGAADNGQPLNNQHLQVAQVTEEPAADCVLPDAAEAMPCVKAREAAQIPANWLDMVNEPNLDNLLTQLDSDADVIYLTLPVKIEVTDAE